jgi:hypothetical protein
MELKDLWRRTAGFACFHTRNCVVVVLLIYATNQLLSILLNLRVIVFSAALVVLEIPFLNYFFQTVNKWEVYRKT